MKNSRLAILTALALTLASGVGYAELSQEEAESILNNKEVLSYVYGKDDNIWYAGTNGIDSDIGNLFDLLPEDKQKNYIKKAGGNPEADKESIEFRMAKRNASKLFKEDLKPYAKKKIEQSEKENASRLKEYKTKANVKETRDSQSTTNKTNEYDLGKFAKVLPNEKKETPTYFPKDSNTKTPTSSDVGAGLGDFFGALKKYDAKNATTEDKASLPNASTTETKNIKNEASEKPNSEKKAINKDDCEYTTAEEGQELDQIFREKFRDPKDNPEAYELFKQLNPKYVAPGEKVYFPPTDAIAELKKTNSGNDVAKKQDTETANSIDKSKCKSVKAQSGQQMVDIFKKEFGDPKDNPDAYKLFQQLNPEFVAPDALVYFPTKEAIEAEKEKSKKSKETKDATAAKDDKSKKDAKNKEAEIKAEIEKINKKLDDNTKKAISGLEKNNKDAYDKIVKDPKEYKRIAELIKNNPNEYIKEVYQTGNSNRTPSLEYFDKSLANLKKTNSSKYSELRAQYEKDLAVAIEGGQGYHNGSYFEVTNLVIVDVYGNKKKVSYSADGKRVETSN